MKRWTKILIGSVVVWVLGAVPLLVYIAFGPADGNPVGFGLLYLAGQMLGIFGIAVSMLMFLAGLAGQLKRGNGE